MRSIPTRGASSSARSRACIELSSLAPASDRKPRIAGSRHRHARRRAARRGGSAECVRHRRRAEEAEPGELLLPLVPRPHRRRPGAGDHEPARRRMPEARISRRYRVLLNGFVVSVPYAKLPELLSLGIAETVYPELHVHVAPESWPRRHRRATVRRADGGEGRRSQGRGHRRRRRQRAYVPLSGRAVVSGGLPERARWRNDAEGDRGEGLCRPRDGRWFDRPRAVVPRNLRSRRHRRRGGDERRGGPARALQRGRRRDAIRRSPNVSGVAPRAFIGNYRVFNVPLPLGGCCSGTTPEIVAAFEAAVQDGMDVINFSGGGPQADPRTDALIETVANVVRAGVVPIVSAGNDRDFFGLGTAGSPATAPDAIAVGATTNAHVFDASFSVVSPSGLGRVPFVPTDDIPQAWTQANQRLVDVGAIAGANRFLCEGALPAGSLQGAIALVSRGGCPYQAKVDRARGAGAIGMVVSDSAAGDPGFSIFQGAGGTISDLDGARLRAAGAGTGGASDGPVHEGSARGPHVLAGRPDELLGRRPDAVRPCAQARRHGAGSEHSVLHLARVRRRPLRHLRGHELLRAARFGRRGAAPPAPPDVDAQAGEVGADVHSRSCVRRHGADAGGIGAPSGRRPRQRGRRRSPGALHRSAVAVVRLPGRQRRSSEPRDPRADLGRRGRGRRLERGGPAAGELERSERDSRAVHARERWHRGRPDGRERGGGSARRETTSASSCFAGATSSGASRTRSRSPARSSRGAVRFRSARARPATPLPAGRTAPACIAGRPCRSASSRSSASTRR